MGICELLQGYKSIQKDHQGYDCIPDIDSQMGK